jgi:N-methylhydantoinase B
VEPTWKLYFDNTRYADDMVLDIKTIYSNLRRGEEMVHDIIDTYGVDSVRGAMQYALDYAETSMRNGIREIEDGTYEATELIDADAEVDEPYRIDTTITIRGDRAEVDFSGTSRQANTSINAGYLDTQTAVLTAFKYLLDRDTPLTSSAMRPIDIVLPPGTILSAMPPEGPIYLYWEADEPALYSIFRALEEPLGEDAVAGGVGSLNIHNANGTWPGTDDAWLTQSQCGGEHGPWGATKAGDADSYQVSYQLNNLDPATEAIENDVPVLITRKEYVTDTAGPGKYRGGASVLKDSLWRSRAQHFVMPLRFKQPSGFGVNGGGVGSTGGLWLWTDDEWDLEEEGRPIPMGEPDVYERAEPIAGRLDPETNEIDMDGEYVYPFAPGKASGRWTDPDTSFRWITNGAGGWGDPLERDPEDVRDDVRDEYVSIEGAYEDYGVVIEGEPRTDPEGLEIDYGATETRREEMRAASSKGVTNR